MAILDVDSVPRPRLRRGNSAAAQPGGWAIDPSVTGTRSQPSGYPRASTSRPRRTGWECPRSGFTSAIHAGSGLRAGLWGGRQALPCSRPVLDTARVPKGLSVMGEARTYHKFRGGRPYQTGTKRRSYSLVSVKRAEAAVSVFPGAGPSAVSPPVTQCPRASATPPVTCAPATGRPAGRRGSAWPVGPAAGRPAGLPRLRLARRPRHRRPGRVAEAAPGPPAPAPAARPPAEAAPGPPAPRHRHRRRLTRYRAATGALVDLAAAAEEPRSHLGWESPCSS
jgi:hypothetical protein